MCIMSTKFSWLDNLFNFDKLDDENAYDNFCEFHLSDSANFYNRNSSHQILTMFLFTLL